MAERTQEDRNNKKITMRVTKSTITAVIFIRKLKSALFPPITFYLNLKKPCLFSFLKSSLIGKSFASTHDTKQKVCSWNLFHVSFVFVSKLLHAGFVFSD